MGLKKLISEIKNSNNFDETLQKVIKSIIPKQDDYFILLNEEKPIGIITEKDILPLCSKNITLLDKDGEFLIQKLINEKIESIHNFKFLYEDVPFPYQSQNEKGEILNVNKKWLEITGYEKDEVIGKKFAFFTDEEPHTINASFKKLLKHKKIENQKIKIRKKNGEIILCSFFGNAFSTDDGLKTHCVFKDITEEVKIEKKLQLSDIVFENTTEAIMITNERGEIVSVNNAFVKITGYTFEEIKYQNPKFLKSGKQDSVFYSNFWREVKKNGTWKGEIWNRKKNGEIYPEWLTLNVVKDKDGNILNYIAIFSDITKIKNSNAKIEFLAHHDPLTNLPNKLLLKARLDKSIEKASELKQNLAIFFIDIDNFKLINDTHGHTIGDKIINLVAKKLQKNIRRNDTISRIGGDEFIIIIEDIDNTFNIEKIAKKIINDFQEAIKMEEYVFETTISIGISLFPNNGLNAEDLIKHADTALFSAKNAGKNQFRFYKNEMTSEILEKIIMKRELNEAIKNNEFEVFYQPQIDIKTNQIIGAEALVRWNHKKLGLLYPKDFISHAEETKLIIPIGNYVLKKACQFMKKLHTEKILENGIIAVNFSNIQIKFSDILKVITEELDNSQLESEYLEIELMESYIMEDASESILLLNKLKNLGVKLSIDDFGTGYSSLNYLKQFPIDKLKIDKSFIDELPINKKDIAITKTIIALGNGLGIKTIAEGVENLEQKEFLLNEGCDEVQGWFYSKALNEENFINFVKNFN